MMHARNLLGRIVATLDSHAWASQKFGQLAVARGLTTSSALVYESHGPPKDTLCLRDWPIEPPKPDQVLIDMIAAPINPSDINQIEGKYPIKPPVPAVAGNEGLAVVRECGDKVRNMAEGDWVVPLTAGQGTWRKQGVFNAADWHRIPSNLPKRLAAQLAVNPVSAMRMLTEHVHLHEGDVVVQNGANSAVGRAVIQIANSRGLRTVNVVRDRPDLQQLREELEGLGQRL